MASIRPIRRALALAVPLALVGPLACQRQAPSAPTDLSTPEAAVTPVAKQPPMPGTAPIKQLAKTTQAQCAMAGIGSSKVSGSLMLEELADGGVKIEGHILGLTPGKHGLHVHEHGDCSSADGSSAGGHFNPTQASHGDIEATASHMGDLGNVEADASGRAIVSVVKRPATLRAGPSSFLGRSLVVHADADDLGSQPAGGSGARIGCGTIKPVL